MKSISDRKVACHVQPRIANKINKIGSGTPSSQRIAQPIFPDRQLCMHCRMKHLFVSVGDACRRAIPESHSMLWPIAVRVPKWNQPSGNCVSCFSRRRKK